MPDNDAAPSALLDCKLGEPLMHGPQPYEWCATHQQLMMTCRASAAPSALLTEEQLAEVAQRAETTYNFDHAQDIRELLAHIRELQKRLNQTIADDCETDTRCRELLKQWDKSDSYGVEPLEVVIEIALKELQVENVHLRDELERWPSDYANEVVESFRSRLLKKVIRLRNEWALGDSQSKAMVAQEIADIVEHFPVER